MTDTRAALAVVLAVGETIRELGEVPSGVLYANLMAMPLLSQLTLNQYSTIIGSLKNAGLVEEKGHVLRWVGKLA